jgi:hypothetical protein
MTANDKPDAEQPKKHGRRTRVCKAEMSRRVHEVFRLLLQGANFLDVKDYARSEDQADGKTPWNVSDKTLHRMIRRAHVLLAEYAERDRGKLMAKSLARREFIYARAVQAGDYRAALRAADSQDALLGMFPSKSRPQPAPASDTAGLVEEVLSDPDFKAVLQASQAWLPPMLQVNAGAGAAGARPGEKRGEEESGVTRGCQAGDPARTRGIRAREKLGQKK